MKNALMRQIALFFIAFGFTLNALMADVFEFSNSSVRGNEVAVLVLVPGMNMDGRFFLDEKPWIEFAQKNKLGIITAHFTSDPEKLLGPEREGYFWPDQGSGKALLEEIKTVYGKDLPILIYGFSGGAQFTGRFIDFAPERIVAWCAYSAQFWDTPKPIGEGGTKARGIVACGELDGIRWQPSFGFYFEGRTQGKDWTWISRKNTGHNRSGALEQFVRDFFQEEIGIMCGKKTGSDIYADVSTMEIVGEDEIGLQEALVSPFRTRALYESWRKIYTP